LGQSIREIGGEGQTLVVKSIGKQLGADVFPALMGAQGIFLLWDHSLVSFPAAEK